MSFDSYYGEPAGLSDEKIEAIFDKHGQYVYDSEEDMGAKVIFWGDFKTAAREIESASPVAAPHQPVLVSERPWEREGWCDKQGQCWWFNPGQPAMSNPHIATSSWRLCRMLNGKPMGAYSLPAHALPLPAEVNK